MPPLLVDLIHARACKPFCEKSLTLPENHSLGEWFKKAYGDEKVKNSLCYNGSAVCQLHKE